MGAYSSILSHHAMFFDGVRNGFYAEAIKNVVTTDSVVLDLGAGLGLHGFMAVECGAKKVYLVEPESIIDIARQVVEKNGLSGKIECIKGKIEEIDLPEKVDCIVSVFTGNFLLQEDLLPSLFHARDNLLDRGGKLIPDRAVMEAVPVSAPDYYSDNIDCWSKTLYGSNFGAIRNFAVNSLYLDTPENREADFLSDPLKLLDLDLTSAVKAECNSQVNTIIKKHGTCHGILGWFKTRIGEKWLSTSPHEKQTHWRQVFLPLDKPLPVEKGDSISFSLNRPEFGEWTWSMDLSGTKQTQSTFNECIRSPEELKKLTDVFTPNLSKKGQVVLSALEKIDGSHSTSSIIDYLLDKHPEFFKSRNAAEILVKSLIKQY